MVTNVHFRWLLGQFWTHRSYLAMSLILTFASVGILLLMPRWTSVLIQEDLPRGQMEPILWHLLEGVSIFLAGSLLGLGRAYTTSIFLHTLGAETRRRIFDHILRISPRRMNFARGGDVLSRVSNDVELFQGSLGSIVSKLIPSIILAICFSVAMAWFSPVLFVLIVVVLSPLVLVSSVFGEILYRATHACQESLARLINRFEELLGGAREIKSFGQEPKLLGRFDALNRDNLKIHIQRDRMDSLHPVSISLIAAFASALLLTASVYMINRGWITSENLTSFFVCLVLAYSPLQEASFASSKLQQFRAVMERIDLILNIAKEEDGPLKLSKGTIRGALTFERVNFAYPDQRFRLTDFNLEIPAGQMVALVGPSGAGKSTLLDFIPRFLVPQDGRVLVDGMDVRQFRLQDFRREIGIVSQEPILFEATLEENLRFGSEDATSEEIKRAAIAANVDEFAQRMPQGYATKIDFRGGNLSVGQRQRVALARVLIRAPRLLLFDEPTSALDAMSEDLVRRAMKRASIGRTTLIVAHRLSTVRDADRVLVLSEGHIIEDGTHDQLMAAGGLYCSMYGAQSDSAEARLTRRLANSIAENHHEQHIQPVKRRTNIT